MPRKSKNKYMAYSKERLLDAVKAVKDGIYSFRQASQIFNIPKTTIVDYAAGRGNALTKSGRKPAIPVEVEDAIAEKVADSANKGFGITKRQLLLKVGQVALQSKIPTPFKQNIPGNDWWRGFTSRHPNIVIRKPEKLTTSRSRMMNKVVVVNYFSALHNTFQENPTLLASTIWNMDKTSKGFEHNPTNVVARKGSRNIPGRTSDSRENITVLATVSASGKAMPLLCIVKGKTPRSLRSFCTIDTPEGTIWTYQEKAWMNDLLGEKLFNQVFLANCDTERPQLLILDSYRSHEVLGLLEVAMRERIIIIALPPHCTHHLQPLDKGVFGPFSKAYDRACTEFLSNHPDNNITKQTWPRILNTAGEATFSAEIIKSSFQANGIYPFNPKVIPESAYAPSDAFDVPMETEEDTAQQPAISSPSHTTTQQPAISSPSDTNTPISVHSTITIPMNSSDGTILALSPIPTLGKDPFMPVVRQKSLNNTFEEVAAYESVATASSRSKLELSDISVLSQEDAALLLMALNTGNTVLSEVSESEINIGNDLSMWNTEVESIFNIPQSVVPKKPKKCALTSHRLLTSDEVVNEKRNKRKQRKT